MKRRKLDSEYIHGLGRWTSTYQDENLHLMLTELLNIRQKNSCKSKPSLCVRTDDLDELEVYGADTKGTELASYSFEVCLLSCNSETEGCFEHVNLETITLCVDEFCFRITMYFRFLFSVLVRLIGVRQFGKYWSMFLC